MANIMDYVAWRGDLSFSESPFNEVDNLILTQLAFIDFDGIVPEDLGDGFVSLKEAAEVYFERHDKSQVSMGMIVPDEILTLFERVGQTRRFGKIRLGGYVNHVDTDTEKQFSAIVAKLGDRTAYIAFRGTDDTIVGWKEDLNLSFLENIPSQIEAREYVERAAAFLRFMPLRLGGHSKGGNLAVFSAVTCKPRTASRIVAVYNNDGPGFIRSLSDNEQYLKLRPRIHTFVPQCSIVGMLLEHDDQYQVVESTEAGVFQHDGFSWQVVGPNFVRLPALSEESQSISAVIKAWISSLNEQERKEFVDALYEWLSSTNAQTLTELNEDRKVLFKSLTTLDSKSKETVVRVVKVLIAEGTKHFKSAKQLETTVREVFPRRRRKTVPVKEK